MPPRIIPLSLSNGDEAVDGLLVTFNYRRLGSATHYWYRINPAWEDWQPIISGREPYGHSLISACEQTVYFQVKNEHGESNVALDSIKRSTEKTARTIRIAEAMRYARPYRFTCGMIWDDGDECATLVETSDGAYILQRKIASGRRFE